MKSFYIISILSIIPTMFLLHFIIDDGVFIANYSIDTITIDGVLGERPSQYSDESILELCRVGQGLSSYSLESIAKLNTKKRDKLKTLENAKMGVHFQIDVNELLKNPLKYAHSVFDLKVNDLYSTFFENHLNNGSFTKDVNPTVLITKIFFISQSQQRSIILPKPGTKAFLLDALTEKDDETRVKIICDDKSSEGVSFRVISKTDSQFYVDIRIKDEKLLIQTPDEEISEEQKQESLQDIYIKKDGIYIQVSEFNKDLDFKLDTKDLKHSSLCIERGIDSNSNTNINIMFCKKYNAETLISLYMDRIPQVLLSVGDSKEHGTVLEYIQTCARTRTMFEYIQTRAQTSTMSEYIKTKINDFRKQYYSSETQPTKSSDGEIWNSPKFKKHWENSITQETEGIVKFYAQVLAVIAKMTIRRSYDVGCIGTGTILKAISDIVDLDSTEQVSLFDDILGDAKGDNSIMEIVSLFESKLSGTKIMAALHPKNKDTLKITASGHEQAITLNIEQNKYTIDGDIKNLPNNNSIQIEGKPIDNIEYISCQKAGPDPDPKELNHTFSNTIISMILAPFKLVAQVFLALINKIFNIESKQEDQKPSPSKNLGEYDRDDNTVLQLHSSTTQ